MKVLLRILLTVSAAFLLTASVPTAAPAGFIEASGQFLIDDPDPGHDDVRENRVFRIDTATGIATSVSPLFTGSTPPAMAGTAGGALLGIRSGRLGVVDVAAGTFNPYGDLLDVNATGFDILSDGRGFIVPFNDAGETQQLHAISLTDATVTPIGSATAIGDAIDAAAGRALGTAEPFLIGLGSVGGVLYGVDLGSLSLIALDPNSGAASVAGAVEAVGSANGGGYTGFAALTGVDEDGDGVFDTLYGAVNFDPTGGRLGGLARFDLTSGTWTLVGSNPGLIYFGFGASVVPEPGSFTLAVIGLLTGLIHAIRKARPAKGVRT